MEEEPRSANPSETPTSSTRGLVVLSIIVLAVAAWMSYQRPQNTSETSTGAMIPATARPADLGGFRPDAWFLPDDEGLGFVEVSEGPFQMGSGANDPLAFENEWWGDTPSQGTVDLPTFYLGRYEVTVAQFAAFVEETGFRVDDTTLQGPPDHPVVNVSWPDALAYCRWLETMLRDGPETPQALRRFLDNGGQVSLPSEAEWEKAARGTDGRIYPWGNQPRRDRANFSTTGTTPVGSSECPECPFPISDMSGNVWELTRSPYQPYPFDPSPARVSLESDALWVMRGGHFADPERNVRAAIRGGADPGARRPFIGFRVVISKFD